MKVPKEHKHKKIWAVGINKAPLVVSCVEYDRTMSLLFTSTSGGSAIDHCLTSTCWNVNLSPASFSLRVNNYNKRIPLLYHKEEKETKKPNAYHISGTRVSFQSNR